MILVKDIGNAGTSVEAIRCTMEAVTFNAARKCLPDRAIIRACRESGYVCRRRLLTPVVTVLHMVFAAFWPEHSFAASWDVLWANAIGHLPKAAGKVLSSGTLSKARKRLTAEVWRGIFAWLADRGQELSKGVGGWRGHRIVLMDGTCVSMPDEQELRDTYGVNRCYHGEGRYPLARLVTLALADTMVIVDWALEAYRSSEAKMALGLLGSLKPGDLLVGDRLFAGANYYVKYMQRGLEFVTQAHQMLKVERIRRIICHSVDDFIGEVKINKDYIEEGGPTSIRLRFIRATLVIRGKRWHGWFVTSLLDAVAYPADELVGIYGRRWRIETLIRAVKLPMGCDVLRSQSAEGVVKEVAARLTALNVVRIIMVEAVLETGQDPLRLSFSHAVRAIMSFSPALASQPVWKLAEIYDAMLEQIARHTVKLRPGRNEPRMIRRDKKHYPFLKTTRQQWRDTFVA